MNAPLGQVAQVAKIVVCTISGLVALLYTYTFGKVLVQAEARIAELGPRLSHFASPSNPHPALTFAIVWVGSIAICAMAAWSLRRGRGQGNRAV